MQNFFFPTWNTEKTRLLAQNEEHEALELAIQKYFMQTDVAKATAICTDILEEFGLNHNENEDTALIITDEKLHISSNAYKKLLVLHVVNEILDMEAVQLAEICQAKGQPFVCAKGCNGCCSQLILCSEVESLLITVFLYEHRTQMEKFLANFVHFDRQAQGIAKSYLRWGQAFYGEGCDDKSHSREDYYIACPFLSDEGICTVYAARPYSCRSAVAVDGKCAEFTPTSKGKRQGMHHMLFPLYTGHHQTRQRLMDNFSLKKRDLHKTVMPYMVHDCIQLPPK